jgi:diaminopimelate epimerase
VVQDGVAFAKGHGTENDFVLLFDPERAVDLTPSLVRKLCDRRGGLGADGVLRIVLAATDPEGARMSDQARWFMDYRNADGSVAEMCGNGVRVFARYLVDSYLEPAGEIAVATRGGLVRVRLGAIGDVSVEMGRYALPDVGTVEVSAGDRSWLAYAVSAPNPHAVAFVDDLAHAGPLDVAPEVRPAGTFPDGVNVEFAVVRGAKHLGMRVYERGVGETRSCGTGACAVAAAASESRAAVGASRDGVDEAGGATGHTAGTARPSWKAGQLGVSTSGAWTVDVPGGRLVVTIGEGRSMTLTGPAVLVAEGKISIDWLLAHR